MNKIKPKAKYIYIRCIIAGFIAFNFNYCSNDKITESRLPEPIDFEDIVIKGDLFKRISLNLQRLEEEKYQPGNVFLTNEESNWWPGDTEGRTVLGLVLNAQSSKKQPHYLEEIIRLFPENFNRKGYFGDIAPDPILDEQQLSSHGWVLRGLSEYYLWKKDSRTLDMIQTIVDSLVLPTKGKHLANYPLIPEERKHAGEYSGTRFENPVNNWILSTDIGCVFIFLDGVIQAYDVTGDERMVPVIEEMIELYLRMDLYEIKAQTHASLTGLRALLRYTEITGKKYLIPEIEKRFELYKNHGMTENFENYNWFQRPQWTEPCAIVDSYTLAVDLWRHTGNTAYIQDAQLIYYNAIGATQRHNGGFGCNTCSGAESPFLRRSIYEAHWCCTMRGAEGLSRAAQYLYVTKGNTVFINFFENNTAFLELPAGKLEVSEETDYPFSGSVKWTFLNTILREPVRFKIFMPQWTTNPKASLNGKSLNILRDGDFIVLNVKPQKGEVIQLEFTQKTGRYGLNNKESIEGYFSFRFGPLIFGLETDQELLVGEDEKLILEGNNFVLSKAGKNLVPVFSIDSEEIPLETYSKQILFRNK